MPLLFSDEEERLFREAGANTFPDGDYQGKLVDVETRLVGQNRDKKLVLRYELSSPAEYRGRTYSHFLSLDNPKAYGYLKGVVAKFGIPTENLLLRDLEAELSKVSKGSAEVFFGLVTKEFGEKKYQNAEIRRVIREENFAQVSQAFLKQAEGDDLPF